jgi:hypothetical protein
VPHPTDTLPSHSRRTISPGLRTARAKNSVNNVFQLPPSIGGLVVHRPPDLSDFGGTVVVRCDGAGQQQSGDESSCPSHIR